MTAREIMAQLAAHFPPQAVSWRPGATFDRDGVKHARALAYIDARDVMERLDAVMGADWQCEYVPMPNGSCCCRIGLKIDGEWRWRSNGAGATDVEAEKGAYSDAMKRAAVLWGVGQYLYALGSPIVKLTQQGKSWVIDKSEEPKLQALLVRNGAPAESPGPKPRPEGRSSQDARSQDLGQGSPQAATPISARAAATVVDPKIAALNKKPQRLSRQDSQALYNVLRASLEFCSSVDALNAWAHENGSQSGKQDGMWDDHRHELLTIARGKHADFKRAAA